MIEEGTDSHLLSIVRVQFMSIDGRLRGQFDLDWYYSHHNVGAMVNVSTDTKSRNTKCVYLHIRKKLYWAPRSLIVVTRKSFETTESLKFAEIQGNVFPCYIILC